MIDIHFAELAQIIKKIFIYLKFKLQKMILINLIKVLIRQKILLRFSIHKERDIKKLLNLRDPSLL